jgi:hypothetical protein
MELLDPATEPRAMLHSIIDDMDQKTSEKQSNSGKLNRAATLEVSQFSLHRIGQTDIFQRFLVKSTLANKHLKIPDATKSEHINDAMQDSPGKDRPPFSDG